MSRRGFTLIELLLVVSLILIICAIAIPNLVRSRMAANESSAVATLRGINNAEVVYSMTYNSGYSDGLNVLAAPIGGGPPSYTAADLADPIIAGKTSGGTNTSFIKQDYIFRYTPTGTFPLVTTY